MIAYGIEVITENAILKIIGEASNLYNEILTDNKKENGSTNRRRMESDSKEFRGTDSRRVRNIQELSGETSESRSVYTEESGSDNRAERGQEGLILDEVSRLEKELGTSINVVSSLDGLSEGRTKDAIKGSKEVLGWYQDGKVYVYLPNARSARDVHTTGYHEVIAHVGLRKLLGTFLDRVYYNLPSEVAKEIGSKALEDEWNFREATEEYLGRLPERFASGEEISELRNPTPNRCKTLVHCYLLI